MSPSSKETLDTKLSSVRTFEVGYIYIKMIVSIIAFVVGLVACVGVHKYHTGWKLGKFKLKSQNCTSSDQCMCTNKSCTVKSCGAVSDCKDMHIEGFDQTFHGSFKNPPKVGQVVKVFYDPKDRSNAMLMANDILDGNKKLIIGIILVSTTLSLAISFFMFKNRKDKDVQSAAGFVALTKMIR